MYSTSSQSGTLTVHIRSAHNLIKADMMGKSDPYCTLYLPAVDPEPRQTSTIRNTLDPERDERRERHRGEE